MAHLLNRSRDLEEGLLKLYKNLYITMSLDALGIPKEDLKKIAFYTSRDAVNMATDPASISEQKIFKLLQEIY